ncbi:hypothetical protein Metbo_1418 [Methanobacterium lacus]|uniref:Lipoprotein n=1 Tax=Methanobacterium lacus (strain AL-21) TaxID=877455 RepID=F0T831_METLA|nr:hypothetical protein [Methanobacterium lacus]ADZ09657.1 hypothetical protein Metbo_1418 [Methanobacterium lacus]
MKIKILAGLLVSIFILGGISSACAVNYDGYSTINVAKENTFELDLLYNEWIDDDGYNHDLLNLKSKERSEPIDGYWVNMYTFKPLKTGTTKIIIKQQVLWWEEERTVDVNVS